MDRPANTITYAFEERPGDGELLQVADGVYWLRMPLPFVLGHINLWVLEDGDGWCVVDTGIASDKSCELWSRVIEENLDQRPISRVLVTHLHPDHVGLAGWLTRRFDIELWMTREEFLLCRNLVADTDRPAPEAGVRFYQAAGYGESELAGYKERFGGFGRAVSPMPDAYRRLQDGEVLAIGRHRWEVVVGRGHSPEHACLFCAKLNLVISGDQILPTISSNVSVYPTEPGANPLADWLDSCHGLQARLPADVLVLPAHGRPFYGSHHRLRQLIEEHELGLTKIRVLCESPKRAVDVFPALFKSRISDGNLIMATGEAVAHLSYLVARGELGVSTDERGVRWYARRP